jgi:hypothetical protein
MKEARTSWHFTRMRLPLHSFGLLATLAVMTACSSESSSNGAGGSAGTPATGGSSAGQAPTAGASSGAGGSGGAPSTGGTTSVAGEGGMPVAGAGGAGGMSGGAGMAGAGGSGGAAGHVPVMSAGCGKVNPANGSRTIMTGGATAMFNVNVPAGYDPNKPMPLGFGFHGFGNGACGPTQGECRGFAMLPAVTVYMKSISDGWEQSQVLEQNITYFQDVLALMKNEYCIDESRIFIAGVSSGGQFIEH